MQDFRHERVPEDVPDALSFSDGTNWVFWIFDDVYGLQVAWLVVDLITNSLATNDDKFKSEFHRHVSVSQNEGLKDPVKIWQ